jgi:hypothetical protein
MSSLLALAAAAALTSPPVTLPSLPDGFEQICMATIGDQAAASAKALAMGFATPNPPLKMRPTLFAQVNITGQLAIKNGAATEIMLVGKGPTIKGRYSTAYCAVARTHDADSVDLRAVYRSRFGFDPQSKSATRDLYSFETENGVQTAVSFHDNDRIMKAIDLGAYRTVMVETVPPSKSVTFDFVILMVPAKKAP